jgi:hypothetical protein
MILRWFNLLLLLLLLVVVVVVVVVCSCDVSVIDLMAVVPHINNK